MGDVNPPDKLAFRSDMATASQKPKDYFKEQNAKAAEKKQRRRKVLKRVLIIVVPIITIIIVGIVVFVIIGNHKDSGIAIPESPDSDGGAALDNVQDLSNLATEVYAPSYKVDENGNVVAEGDLEAVERTFAAALADQRNAERRDTIYLAQINFYASIEDNQKIVDLAGQVDPNKLNSSEKVRFYNLVYLAYTALGDKSQAEHYYRLMRSAAANVTGIGG